KVLAEERIGAQLLLWSQSSCLSGRGRRGDKKSRFAEGCNGEVPILLREVDERRGQPRNRRGLSQGGNTACVGRPVEESEQAEYRELPGALLPALLQPP